MKSVKSLQIASQSSEVTVPTGYGALFASGSTELYWKNSSGTIYNLTSASAGSTQILYYTGSNPGGGRIDYTYSPPGNLYSLEIICIGGGGGGGGGGSRNGIGSNGCSVGGGGGAGVWYKVNAAQLLSATYTISVGGGGAGGAGGVGVANGVNGTAGGPTWFSSSLNNVVVLAAAGGGGLLGGSGTTGFGVGTPGLASNCLPSRNYALQGKPSAPRANNSAWSAACAGNIFDGAGGGSVVYNAPTTRSTQTENQTLGQQLGHCGGGGGCGGHVELTTLTVRPGTSGSNGYTNGIFVRNNTGSPGDINTAGGAGKNNMISSLFRFTSSNATYGLGGGGHGGGVGTTGPGGAGGNGGLYGSGGGGGGSSYSNTSGGRGGSGSSGLCILIEYY